jgi:hypothetical protein
LVNVESAGRNRSGDNIESWGIATGINSRPLTGPIDKWHAEAAGRRLSGLRVPNRAPTHVRAGRAYFDRVTSTLALLRVRVGVITTSVCLFVWLFV